MDIMDTFYVIPDLTEDPHMRCFRCGHWNFEHSAQEDPPGCRHIEQTTSRVYFRCDCAEFDDVPF